MKKIYVVLLLLLAQCLPSPSLFSYNNWKVAKGKASVYTQEKAIFIEADHMTVLDCDTFSITPEQTVTIRLPNSFAKIFIQSRDTSPCKIWGTLQCNGSVFLFNENGISNNGTIHCNAFTGNTLQRTQHEKTHGPIINSGTIDCNKGIFLTTNGLIVNSNTLLSPGGHIILSGNIVHAKGNSIIDVSDKKGGGKISLGGGFHGEDALIQNANLTVVDKNASLHADATENGEGGTIIIWSNTLTRFLGSASAIGKGAGNSGGAIEIASGRNLDMLGEIDLSSTQGKAGPLLLD